MQDKWLDGGSAELCQSLAEKKLKGLSVRRASGPYEPNIKVLKMLARSFAIPLTNIFNKSFRTRSFPKIWKRYVCGIPKIKPCSAVEVETNGEAICLKRNNTPYIIKLKKAIKRIYLLKVLKTYGFLFGSNSVIFRIWSSNF